MSTATSLASSVPVLPFRHWLGRSLALALASFCLLNVAGSLLVRDFDATLWLLDLRLLPHRSALLLVALLGVALAFLGLGGAMRWPRFTGWSRAVVLAGALVALVNALVCWRVWVAGSSASAFPLPFSVLVMLALLAAAAWCGPVAGAALARFAKLGMGASCAATAAIFLQMSLFGLTDYRTQADVAVVYGARAFPDGRCSSALEDRVLAGVDLYRQGLVPLLLMSGGPVDGAQAGDVRDEPEAMKRLAMAHGVPEAAILLDPQGISTVATAENTARLAQAHRWKKILVVSHFYHLSRAKLTMQRAGVTRQAQVRSVPASMRDGVLIKLPKFMLREVAAFVKDWAVPKRAAV